MICNAHAPMRGGMAMLNEAGLSWAMAAVLRRGMPEETAVNRWEAVFMPRVVCRLLFSTCTVAKVEAAVQPVFKAHKMRVGAGVSSPTQLLKAVGIGDVWQRLIMVDRLGCWCS